MKAAKANLEMGHHAEHCELLVRKMRTSQFPAEKSYHNLPCKTYGRTPQPEQIHLARLLKIRIDIGRWLLRSGIYAQHITRGKQLHKISIPNTELHYF